VDGRDLSLELPLTPWEAALGAQVQVPTPGGTFEVGVPRGSQAGRKLRLRGKGLPGDPPGDFYAVLSIVLPAPDTPAAEAAYRALAAGAPGFNPRANLGVS
jgi:curved DNA-binding protein